jgi:hypothetical protein
MERFFKNLLMHAKHPSSPAHHSNSRRIFLLFGVYDMIRAMSETISYPRVQPGYRVAVKFHARSGESESLEFDLVPDEQADYQEGFLGVSTPLAQAILGERAGVTIPYFTDEMMAVEILSIRASTRTSDSNAAAQRDAALKDAKDQIEFTNAVLFAASVDTKWGAYDADGLDYEAWKARKSKDTATRDEGE